MNLHIRSVLVATTCLIAAAGSFSQDSQAPFYPLAAYPEGTWLGSLVTPEFVDGRYLVAVERYLTTNDLNEPIIKREVTYGIDCAQPMGIAIRMTSVNNSQDPQNPSWTTTAYRASDAKEFRPREIMFKPLDMALETKNAPGFRSAPNSARLLVYYACMAARAPAKEHEAIAKRLYRSGGISDLTGLACNVQLKDEDKSHRTYKLAISETSGFVRWQGIWQPEAAISASEIVADIRRGKQVTRLTVSRFTGGIELRDRDAGVIAFGWCDKAPSQADVKF